MTVSKANEIIEPYDATNNKHRYLGHPILSTRATQIWRLHTAGEELDATVNADEQGRLVGACCGVWLIRAPWAHRFWSYHLVFLQHLRTGDLLPPPIFTKHNATHEMMMYAVDPDKQHLITGIKDVVGRQASPALLLHPADVVQQFTVEQPLIDVIARRVIEDGLLLVVDQKLIPDSDGRSGWKKFLVS